MKRFFKKLFTFALKLYFRRIEIFGEEHVPEEGPIIFVLNHHNGLVDPLFILCLSHRNVSFLAKSTLFNMPVVSYLVRLFDSIPVYRKEDGVNTNQNQKMFATCRKMLDEGKALALFPEGVSHNETKLLPLKSGTARIALGAASQGYGEHPLRIVPGGLYFTEKFTYRSEALLYYGKPFEVKKVELDEEGNPSREDTNELTQQIADSLKELIIEVQHEEALSIIQRAEKIFSGSFLEKERKTDLSEELNLQKQFVQAYEILQEKAPGRLLALKESIEQFEYRLAQFGLSTDDLTPQFFTPKKMFQFVSKRLPILPILLPFALVGTILHFPSYRLIGMLATRGAKGDADMLSTIKILGALMFFPLTWFVAAGGAWFGYSWMAGLATLILAPLTGWSASFFWEHFDDFKMRLRSFSLFFTRRTTFDDLIEERQLIREELISLGEMVSEI